MGSELVSDSSSSEGEDSKGPLRFFTDIFNLYLPFYLSIGMTYEQYWNEDCMLTIHYRKAHEMITQRQNQMAWLQGMYFYEALCDVAPVLVTIPAKGASIRPYSDQPYAITAEERNDRNTRKEEDTREGIRNQFLAFMEAHNSKIRKEDKDSG